jgi:hypothetical protein
VTRLAGIAALLLVLAAGATAGTPDVGVLVPQVSLGGVHLGWTKQQVESRWGRAEGRCVNCRRETLYFNRYAFRPQGAGVELVKGRVVAVFTLWAPPGWRTTKGLVIGEPDVRVEATYPEALHTACPGYDAYVLPGRQAKSVVYVADGAVWGFALLRPDHGVCL